MKQYWNDIDIISFLVFACPGNGVWDFLSLVLIPSFLNFVLNI